MTPRAAMRSAACSRRVRAQRQAAPRAVPDPLPGRRPGTPRPAAHPEGSPPGARCRSRPTQNSPMVRASDAQNPGMLRPPARIPAGSRAAPPLHNQVQDRVRRLRQRPRPIRRRTPRASGSAPRRKTNPSRASRFCRCCAMVAVGTSSRIARILATRSALARRSRTKVVLPEPAGPVSRRIRLQCNAGEEKAKIFTGRARSRRRTRASRSPPAPQPARGR